MLQQTRKKYEYERKDKNKTYNKSGQNIKVEMAIKLDVHLERQIGI